MRMAPPANMQTTCGSTIAPVSRACAAGRRSSDLFSKVGQRITVQRVSPRKRSLAWALLLGRFAGGLTDRIVWRRKPTQVAELAASHEHRRRRRRPDGPLPSWRGPRVRGALDAASKAGL